MMTELKRISKNFGAENIVLESSFGRNRTNAIEKYGMPK